jgi:hypothetical protein
MGQKENAQQDHALVRAPQELKGTSVSIVCDMTDTQGGERGLKTKESMENACKTFEMNLTELKDSDSATSLADVDFFLTDSPSLYRLIKSSNTYGVNRTPLGVVCVCTDRSEKTSVETRLARQIAALGWIAEVVTQPQVLRRQPPYLSY